MAIVEHPLTGVRLNVIEVTRKSLNFAETVTAIILRQKGHSYHAIAQMLGTNTFRIGEALRGTLYPSAQQIAQEILTGKRPRGRSRQARRLVNRPNVKRQGTLKFR